MAANNQDKPRPPLTKLARKYGVYNNQYFPENVSMFQGYKSGLTPISPHREDDSGPRRWWKGQIASYQFLEFKGFPTEWIRALRAYVPTAHDDFAGDWTVAQLDNPIHPLMAGVQWETLETCLMNYPSILLDEERGFMLVSVPLTLETIISKIKYVTGRKQTHLASI